MFVCFSLGGSFSFRDPEDLLERLDLMENKDLKYFTLNAHDALLIMSII